MFKAKIKIQDDDGNWLVPSEVLLHILKLVENRKNVALTCTKLYQIACNIEKNQKPLIITTDKLVNSETFESIIASQRQFNKILIDTCKVSSLELLWRLKAICFKYGATINDFNWESCKLNRAEIVSILNFMPNLKSLSAIAWKLPDELYDEPIPMLNHQQLKELKIFKCDKSTIVFFTNFLILHSIDNLNIHGDFEDFLMTQQKVTVLELHVDLFDYNPDYNSLTQMNLTHLTLKLRRYKDANEQSVIQKIICNQPNLTYLDVVNCEGCFDDDDAAFAAICNLTSLETLKLNIDGLASSAFTERFTQLNRNLKSLEVESVEHNFAPVVTIIDELSGQEMNQLKQLKIYLSDVGIPLDRIERMGKKYKKLNSFTARCDHPLPLDCYLVNMNRLESLKIDYHYSKEFSKLCNGFDFKCANIKHLSLQGFSFGSDDVNSNEITLLKLADTLPNLETLDLDAAFPFNTEFIIRIKEKLVNLHTIKKWSMIQSGDNYKKLDYQSILNLKQTSRRLKCFSLELRMKVIDMDMEVSRVKEDLEKEFNVAMTRVGGSIVIRIEKK